MVFARSKLTPLQQIGGADYDSEDEEAEKTNRGRSSRSGYESDPGGRGRKEERGRATQRKNKPLTYAEFLRAQERSFGPQGAIDSTKSSEAKHFKEKPMKRSRSVGSLVDLVSASKDLEEERNQQLRKIEQNMALARAQKRDLRRLEGDLYKNQHSINKTFKKFESVVANRMSKKDEQLMSIDDSSNKTQQENAHIKKTRMSTRGAENRSMMVGSSRERRKADLQLSSLEKAYKAKVAALNLKQLEIERLTLEFTQKLKAKEEEEYRLKKELAELSIAVAFELKKKGAMELTKEKESQKVMKKREKEDLELESGYESSKEKTIKMRKKTENEKQSYTKQLEQHRSSAHARQRETGRSITSTKVKKEDANEHLQFLQKSLDTTQTDLQAIQIQNRIKAAGDRKLALSSDDLLNKNNQRHQAALIRAWNNEVESRRYVMEDVKTRLGRNVSDREKKSHSLSQDVRTLGLARNNQEKIVNDLERKLEKLKLDNQRTMLQQLAQQKAQERKLEEELLRKKGELISVNAKCGETLQTSVKEKVFLRKDQFVLNEIEKEHKRLLNVANRTDELYSL